MKTMFLTQYWGHMWDSPSILNHPLQTHWMYKLDVWPHLRLTWLFSTYFLVCPLWNSFIHQTSLSNTVPRPSRTLSKTPMKTSLRALLIPNTWGWKWVICILSYSSTWLLECRFGCSLYPSPWYQLCYPGNTDHHVLMNTSLLSCTSHTVPSLHTALWQTLVGSCS